MIDAKDLMIGNLVECNGHIHTIEAIGFMILKTDKGDLLLKSIDKGGKDIVKGIPITEEWLLQFGFQEVYNSEFRHKFDNKVNNFIGFDFSKVEDKSMEGFRYYGIYIKINYIHELQNLYLGLTKQQLKILE